MDRFALPAAGFTVFCDFDGPIVDVSERYYRTYRLCLEGTCAKAVERGEPLSAQPLVKTDFWELKCDRVPDTEIARRSGLGAENIPHFIRCIQGTVNQPHLLGLDRLQHGVDRALMLLRASGVRVVIVTLRCRDQVTRILDECGLLCLLEGVYGTDDCTIAYRNTVEQKRRLFELALADSTTFVEYAIGDTEADILAARALGIPTIALTCGIRSHAYLKRYQPEYLQTDLASTTEFLLGQLAQTL
ncbi:putative phosphatase [Rubidibacter lacunae KORDI 51-2]|uniref:Putative phosphatase n=1 Tax=Rubidibacter lacunae KORDI 51-2 TaxID=582515 RepID=U5DEV4_9CHRO|nr:HAD family hydrolase [Rubidibacter lacunae]ERN40121.1 putative phosphatase [Rubidibacter lacunae KORDI 51-2]